jgi:CO dehydrogenase maturation factor
VRYGLLGTAASSVPFEREALAITGKGGTGKTTIAAIMAKILAARGRKPLVIDADPPTSLAYAVGASNFRTVGELRRKLIEDPGEKRRIADRHMRDVLFDEAVMDLGGMSLLVLGRGEGPGCFCGVNELLRFGIESLSKKYSVTLIDCEAGIEQINRRVIRSISTLVMVSDLTIKGLRAASYLKEIAVTHGVEGQFRTGLILNRVRDGGVEELHEKAREMGLNLLGTVPEDEKVAEYDRIDRPTVDLPEDSESVLAVQRILKDLGLVC